ncbi:MAG: CheW protein [Frankiales bacterium]|nr:CheW protein [Frankiales bacterium]
MTTDLQDADAAVPPVEVVLLRVGDGAGSARLAVPMAVVDEVGRPPGLTRVPGLPAWVAGVANWRGRVLAVLDLAPLLGTGPARPGTRGRLVVLSSGGVTVALLVQAVDGTVLVAPDAVEPPLASLSSAAGSLLSGQVTDDAGPYGLADVTALFALADTLPRPRRAG